MNANDFFANKAGLKKGDYLSNQFGFTAGGPAVTNKTFWFADYEGSLIKQARTWVTTVPTAAQRASGFTNYSDLITLQTGTVGADAPRPIVPARHDLRSRNDPAGHRRPGRSGDRAGWHRRPASCAIRSPTTPFPANRIDPNALRLINLYPAGDPGRIEQQLHRQSAQQRRHARVRHARRSQFQRERSLLRALQLLQQSQDPPVTVRRRWRWRRVQRG